VNPYRIETPGVVSFSGGRTSGFMLRQILDAYDGELPDDLLVTFQNTGLEHAATYRFIHEVETRWGVPIKWLEYALDDEGEPTVVLTDHDGASRNGEPFNLLIGKKGYLPNPVSRICTVQLKMRTQQRYLRSLPAFADGWTSAVGLRYDEPRRALRLTGDTSLENPVAPMYHAKHTEEDVLAFWRDCDFDLDLPLAGNMAGNCVGCFLKSQYKLEVLAQEMPEYFEWWIQAERKATETADAGAVFRQDRPSYANLLKQVREQGQLFSEDAGDTISCFCTD